MSFAGRGRTRCAEQYRDALREHLEVVDDISREQIVREVEVGA
jgi:hypothetical protein